MPSKFKASKSEADSQQAVAKRDEILSKTHVEISAWIDSNIENMGDVRAYLKRITRLVKANQESSRGLKQITYSPLWRALILQKNLFRPLRLLCIKS